MDGLLPTAPASGARLPGRGAPAHRAPSPRPLTSQPLIARLPEQVPERPQVAGSSGKEALRTARASVPSGPGARRAALVPDFPRWDAATNGQKGAPRVPRVGARSHAERSAGPALTGHRTRGGSGDRGCAAAPPGDATAQVAAAVTPPVQTRMRAGNTCSALAVSEATSRATRVSLAPALPPPSLTGGETGSGAEALLCAPQFNLFGGGHTAA